MPTFINGGIFITWRTRERSDLQVRWLDNVSRYIEILSSKWTLVVDAAVSVFHFNEG